MTLNLIQSTLKSRTMHRYLCARTSCIHKSQRIGGMKTVGGAGSSCFHIPSNQRLFSTKLNNTRISSSSLLDDEHRQQKPTMKHVNGQNLKGANGIKIQVQPEETKLDGSNKKADTTKGKVLDFKATGENDLNITSDEEKSGTPSPWAVFDAWGAGAGINPPIAPEDEAKLSPESVRIPTNEDHLSPLSSPLENSNYNEAEIIEAYDKFLKQRSSVHFGYPYNLMYNHEELFQFMKYSINNLGDPFITSNYGVHSRQFECAVIDFFASLYGIEQDKYWGYVTTCGTESNLHGILLARECHPDGILYSSKETHYSIFKAARYYRMDAKAIPTLPQGEIDYDILEEEIEKNRDRDVIINVNIGTTVKGAVDNLDRILRILQNLNIPRERFYIHCDGALFAMMMPFVDYAPEVSFRKPIDSIAVSGHKMLGCPMPCGVSIARKEHVKKVEQRIDYLNSVDTTIMGSRNGQTALYLWYSLRKKGLSGIKRDVV